MDASSGGSDQLPPSANDGEQQVMRQENGGNERRNAATTASSGTGNSNPSAVSSESSARGPSPAAPSTTNAAIPTGDLLPPPLPFPLPLPPAAALGGLFRDLPAPTQFFTPPPPIQIIGGAGGDGALPDRSVVGNEGEFRGSRGVCSRRHRLADKAARRAQASARSLEGMSQDSAGQPADPQRSCLAFVRKHARKYTFASVFISFVMWRVLSSVSDRMLIPLDHLYSLIFAAQCRSIFLRSANK